MKILFFTDTHSSKRMVKKIIDKSKKVDFLVCLGDISFFEQGLKLILQDLDKIGKKIIMLPGNHEDEITLQKLCEKTKNIIYMHEMILEIGDVLFVSYGSGGFLIEDTRFDEFINEHKLEIMNAKKVVLLTHQPPFNTKLDLIYGKPVGNMNIKDFIVEYKPILAVSGHLHDNFNKKEKIGNTLVINPGPYGKIINV